jgi:hypothetical protein
VLEARVVPTILDLSTAPGLSGTLHGAVFTGATRDNTAANGVVDPFVQLQHAGLEQGFNTDAHPYNSPNDAGTDVAFNHSLQGHAIPIVVKGGITYYEFALNINQDSTAPLLSLDELRIYVSPLNTLNSYDHATGELNGLLPVYDLDAGLDPLDDTYVKLNSSFTSGSGNGVDLLLDIPTADLGTAPAQFVYLYSKFGVQNLNPGDTNGSANGGYEQWGCGDSAPLQLSARISASINEYSPAARTGVNSVPENAVVYATSTVSPANGTLHPTGMVTYYFYDSSSPVLGSTAPVLTWPQDVSLSNGSVPDSQHTAPLAPGSYSFLAVYSGDNTYVGTVSSIEPLTVLPAAVASFSVDGPSDAQHAGYAFSITVTAHDAFNNPLTDYTGTVHFSSTDGNALLPADYTFTAGDHGVHSFSGTLQTAGQQTISVTDTANSAATGSTSVLVDDLIPGVHFSLVPSVSSTPAGTPFGVTVTAYDENNQVATGYQGTIHFTTADHGPGVVLPPDYTFTSADSGEHLFHQVTLVTAGPQSLSINDTSSLPNPLGASTTVTVIPATAISLSLTGFPSPVTAGTAGMFTVSALDGYGNLATSYSGTVHFSSSDAQAGLPADTLLSNGTGTFTATLNTAGTQSLTATDVAQPSLTGTQTDITVIPGLATALWVTGFPPPTTAGVSGSFTVTAVDARGNIATGYRGTVHFTSSDSQATLPADYTFTSDDAGSHAFTAILDTAGQQNITATDTNAPGIHGAQTIQVLPAGIASFQVDAPALPQHAGYAFNLTVTAHDVYNNPLSGYTGTVHFSSTDGNAQLPSDYTFTAGDQGVHTFSGALQTTGQQTIGVTDTTNSAATGSTSVLVDDLIPGLHFTLIPSVTTTPAGTPFSVTVTAYDANNQVATGYQGTIHFTTADHGADVVIPPDYTFTSTDNGVHVFNPVTLVTVGPQTLSINDTSSLPNPAGATTSVTVIPAAAISLSLTGFPSPVSAGTAGMFSVSALDAYGNLATSYSGTVHFSSSDAQAGLPADTLVSNGTGSFTATLKTGGTQSLTATDIAQPSLTGMQTGIQVNPGGASTLAVTGFPSPTTAGVPGSFVVTARDAYGNVATSYTGTIHFSSSDAQAVLPGNTMLMSGIGGFTATFHHAGIQTLTAADTAAGPISGSQTGITVTPGAVSRLSVSGFPTPQTAGVPGSFTVTALDSFGNPVDSYTGTIRFNSSDAQSSLPGDAVLRGGTGTFRATFKTAGVQTLTATDTTSSGISGVDDNIKILPETAVRFRFDSPMTATAGTAFPVTVTALDSFNNTASGYRGTVRFTSSDASAALPADYAFTSTDAGTYTFKVTLKTVGSQSITATDSLNDLSATRIGIAVSVAAASRLVLAGYPPSGTAGLAANFTVTAEDAFGNTVTNYAGTVSFSSSDGQAVLPPTYTFSTADDGSRSFTITLKTAGNQSLTVTDRANKLTTTLGAITVNSAAVSQLATAFPPSTTAGIATSFTVTAEDAYGNPVTGYTSTVVFSSTDSQAVLPPAYTFSTADNGSHNFTATLKTPGTQNLAVIASDNSFGSLQTGITVIPAAVSKIDLIAPNLVGIQSGFLTADTAYIGALYQSLLNRPVDSGGLSHWLQMLLAGVSRQQLATAIWQSPEHRGVEVDQFYVTFLGRSPDPAGRMTWVNAFLAGATEVDVMRGLLTSAEYQATHASDTSFVSGLYSQVLGRAADPAGQAAWLLALQNGVSRPALAQAVLTSAEADRRVVDQYYMSFLNRAADPAGEQAWTDVLVSGRATLESVGESILASDEYFSRVAGA